MDEIIEQFQNGINQETEKLQIHLESLENIQNEKARKIFKSIIYGKKEEDLVELETKYDQLFEEYQRNKCLVECHKKLKKLMKVFKEKTEEFFTERNNQIEDIGNQLNELMENI